MTAWLWFGSEAQAASAVRQVDALVGNPRPGRDPVTGRPKPGTVGEATWAVPVQRRDGRWGFPRHPEADPQRPFDVEAWDPGWFPQNEEDA